MLRRPVLTGCRATLRPFLPSRTEMRGTERPLGAPTPGEAWAPAPWRDAGWHAPTGKRAGHLWREMPAHLGEVRCAQGRSEAAFSGRGHAFWRDRARWLLTTALTSFTAVLPADRS